MGCTKLTYRNFNFLGAIHPEKRSSEEKNRIKDYAGNYLYQGGTLQFFNHPEGYVENDNGTFRYHYQYKDHLGNVRLTYADLNNSGTIEPSSEILDEKNYYPFGLEHQGYNSTVISENNFKTYQGKEFDESLELDWHDFGARQYDPAIGRWISPDPLSEEFSSWSTYNAMSDNPINFVDPTGMAPLDWYKNLETGEMEWFNGSYEIEGYEHLGYTVGETDVDNNRTLYDGDTKSEHYNGELVKSYKNEESVTSFVSSNILEPLVSFAEKGTQSLVNGFQGAGYGLFKSFTEDVDGMDFGEDFFLMDFNSDTTYNNGKWINVDPMSMGEKQFAKDFALDATSTIMGQMKLPNALKTGTFTDTFTAFGRDSAVVNFLDKLLNGD